MHIHAGRNELTFSLRQTCRFVLLFVDGETPVPGWPMISGFEPLDGDGTIATALSRSCALEGAASEPGRYSLELSGIAGFEPIPDEIITVRRGEIPEYVIQLVREK